MRQRNTCLIFLLMMAWGGAYAQFIKLSVRTSDTTSFDDRSSRLEAELTDKVTEVMEKYVSYGDLLDDNQEPPVVNNTSIRNFKRIFASDGILVNADFEKYPDNIKVRDYANLVLQHFKNEGLDFSLSDILITKMEFVEYPGVDPKYVIDLKVNKVMFNGLESDGTPKRFKKPRLVTLDFEIEVDESLSRASITRIFAEKKDKPTSLKWSLAADLGYQFFVPNYEAFSNRDDAVSLNTQVGGQFNVMVHRQMFRGSALRWVAGLGLTYMSMTFAPGDGGIEIDNTIDGYGGWDVRRRLTNEGGLTQSADILAAELPVGLIIPIYRVGLRSNLDLAIHFRPSYTILNTSTISGKGVYQDLYNETPIDHCTVDWGNQTSSSQGILRYGVSIQPTYVRDLGSEYLRFYISASYTHRLGNWLNDGEVQRLDFDQDINGQSIDIDNRNLFIKSLQPNAIGIHLGILYNLTKEYF